MALSIAARSCAVLGRKVRRYQGMGSYHRRPIRSAMSSPESRSLLANDCLSRALSESPSWRPRSGSPINSRIRSSTRPWTNSFNCSIDNDESSMEREYGPGWAECNGSGRKTAVGLDSIEVCVRGTEMTRSTVNSNSRWPACRIRR
jgi:hypothetical protein